MDKIKKILAPTDLSKLSQVGVSHSLRLAKAIGAEVTVYHVVSQGELMQYHHEMQEDTAGYPFTPSYHPLKRYEHALARFMKDHFSDLIPGVKVQEKVEMGMPDRNIVNLAEEEGSDLIVISTHGRTGLSHMLVGSVTEKVVRHAPCPVLSIHPKLKEEATQKSAAMG